MESFKKFIVLSWNPSTIPNAIPTPFFLWSSVIPTEPQFFFVIPDRIPTETQKIYCNLY